MSQPILKLSILDGEFTIHRFSPNHKISQKVYESDFYSISKTEDEFSVVCSSSILLDSEKSESGWSCIKIIGPLDFSLTGILAEISTILSKAGISIFAFSTYDTDYILMKKGKLQLAEEALLAAGHIFEQ
jgi:hypothetical protein